MITQKDLQDFKESLNGKSKEELEKMEQEYIKEMDELDKTIANLTFDLPKENYKVVADAIKYFLNKQDSNWQYVKAFIAMYDFWTEKNPKKIPYPMLDQVLNTLGEMKFTGYEEWAKIMMINKYLEPVTKEYAEYRIKGYELASKHSIVMDAMGLKNPIQVQQG